MTEAKSAFVYVTYIRTTPEALWTALTTAEFVKQYWFGMHLETDWTPGATWKLRFPDGRIADGGEILEIDRPRRLVLRWRNEMVPEFAQEGFARCSLELEPQGDVVRLTINHSNDVPQSKFIAKVSGGWPRILSNLKSLLETGTVLLT